MKMTDKKERAPEHLALETRTWWESVVAAYTLEEHHRKLLTLAGESWDRCKAARTVIDAQGLTYDDRHGQPRTRPEIAIERDSRLAFTRILREIDLDSDPPSASEAKRPPQLTKYRRSHAA